MKMRELYNSHVITQPSGARRHWRRVNAIQTTIQAEHGRYIAQRIYLFTNPFRRYISRNLAMAEAQPYAPNRFISVAPQFRDFAEKSELGTPTPPLQYTSKPLSKPPSYLPHSRSIFTECSILFSITSRRRLIGYSLSPSNPERQP